MAKAKRALNFGQLAMLFTQLKQFETAGLSVDQAFLLIAKSDERLKKPLTFMQQRISKGSSISEAGNRVGIFNETQKMLIHAGEASGTLADVYGRLAVYYEGLDKRNKKIKSRLYFPALVLCIAMFVQPLPALVASEISGFNYLQRSVGRLLIVGFAVYLLIKLPDILANLGVGKSWHRLQLRLPFVSDWIIKRQINEFFFMLAIMLESGLSFQSALPKAVATIKNVCLREQFDSALPLLNSGASVFNTLKTVPVINGTMLQIINSGEQSGKLESNLMHFSRLEADNLALQDEALAEWLPRLVYGVIAAWMAYSIFGSSISSRVPTDL
jgi:general secretion pathway protein F